MRNSRGRWWVVLFMVAALQRGAVGEPLPKIAPSPAPIRPITNHYFGVEIVDPYRWMEDAAAAEFKTWLKEEGDYARATLDSLPIRSELLKELEHLDARINTFPSALNRVGGRFFYMKTPPPTDVYQLFVREGPIGPERLLFNPEKWSTSGSTYSLDLYHAAPDGEHVVCRLSQGGSEKVTLQVIETTTGSLVGPPIVGVGSGNISWHPNRRAFFYSRSPDPRSGITNAPRKRRVYLHRLHEDAATDRPIFGFGLSTNVPMAEKHSGSIHTSSDSDYLVGVVREGVDVRCELYVAPLVSLEAAEIPWRKVCHFSDEIFGYALQRNELILSSHQNAPRGKLLRVSCARPNLSQAQLLMPEPAGVLGSVANAQDALYVTQRDGISSRLLRIPSTGDLTEEIPLPLIGSVERVIHHPRQAGVTIALVSWTRPSSYYALSPRTRRFTELRLDEDTHATLIPLHAEQVKVPSKDGTLVPLTIIYRQGLARDGRRPTLLHGYGAYGMAQKPSYDLSRQLWFARGGVYAVAHVRGGGEQGKEWYEAGKGSKKQNGIDDFIACAEHLIAQGYTRSSQLAAKSLSAGGLLVGRAMTQRPELFRAVIIEVGAVDALRFEVTSNGPPNIPEWGSTKSQAGFEALRAMSPYEHVRTGVSYPAVLLTVGVNDPRVPPWQPAKLAARLRAATSSKKPVLLAVNYDEGHFHTTVSSFRQHDADTWSFLLWQLGEK